MIPIITLKELIQHRKSIQYLFHVYKRANGSILRIDNKTMRNKMISLQLSIIVVKSLEKEYIYKSKEENTTIGIFIDLVLNIHFYSSDRFHRTLSMQDRIADILS